MTLGPTQPLTEVSTRNRPESKARTVRKSDFTAICEPIFETIWGPRRLATLSASTVCYRDSFTLWRRSVLPVRYELDCKYCYK
jgi:hypothetical protein